MAIETAEDSIIGGIAMQWPERPTCHNNDSSPYAQPEFMVWRAADWRKVNGKVSEIEPYEQTWRTCGYCGSIHPEDLLAVLKAGATLSGSDWKYGWPHKFYVNGIPNPIVGQMIPNYAYCGVRERLGPNAEPTGTGGWREKVGEHPAPTTQTAKWYNVHLLDAGYDDNARAAIITALAGHSGIVFSLPEGKLLFNAPRFGYQR